MSVVISFAELALPSGAKNKLVAIVSRWRKGLISPVKWSVVESFGDLEVEVWEILSYLMKGGCENLVLNVLEGRAGWQI